MELTLPKSSAPSASRAAVYKLHDRSGLRKGSAIAVLDCCWLGTTPIYPPYGVTRLMARPGEIVERGKPLFYIEAADMVQAQNDFLVALAGINRPRSRVTITEIIEKQNRTLYEGKAGSLRDFRTAQADLAQARADLRTAESGLEAARNRLVILARPTMKSPRSSNTARSLQDADLRAAVRHRRAAQDRPRPICELRQYRCGPSGLHHRRPRDGVDRRLCARERGAEDLDRTADGIHHAGLSEHGVQSDHRSMSPLRSIRTSAG
jgi:hypothetical protein